MTGQSSRQRSRRRRLLYGLAMIAGVYVCVAYVALPLAWDAWFRFRRPHFEGFPRTATTTVGIPADPLNVAIVGDRDDVVAAMKAARWRQADALGLDSSLKIVEAVALGRPYVHAPVSSLYLFGRREDLAFEQPIGSSPRRRRHVRFWLAEASSDSGRPLWIGAATFDQSVGFSHTTGEITHHIAPDVDAERDFLVASLKRAEAVGASYWLDDFHSRRTGRNGGGDRWETDGRLAVCELKPR